MPESIESSKFVSNRARIAGGRLQCFQNKFERVVWFKFICFQWQVFLGRPVDTLNPGRCHHHVWCWAEKFSKFVSPDTLKMDSLATSLIRFLRKTLFKLLKLSLQKTLSWMIFKKSYIHIPNLSGYKLVRAAKQSELKRCSK